jgi:hypothetical protein
LLIQRDRSPRSGESRTVVGESAVLELLGREVAERAVAALAVVEDFELLEDLGDQLAPSRPRAAVHELLLERREEVLGDGVGIAVALGAHRHGDPGVAGLLAEAETDVLRARSLWCTSPGPGRRRETAICSASTTSSERMWSAIDEPTIRRL